MIAKPRHQQRHSAAFGLGGVAHYAAPVAESAPEGVEQRDEAVAKARFDEYVLPEVDVMYRVAMSLTRNSADADAEDLVQDTLLRAFRAIDRFDGRYPRAWLLTILRNAQINRVRRKRPELLRDPDATMDRVADTSDGGRTAEELVVDMGFDAEVESAFLDLSDKLREVVQLVDIEGLSYQETADKIGVPVGTVMSRLHRAREKIKKRLQAAGMGPREAST
jgi:RNA polymerase sigma-70 factor (ECF subfamily)